MSKSLRFLAGATVAVVALAGNAHAFTVPDFTGTDPTIGKPGYPDFSAIDASASLTRNVNGTFTLSLNGSTSACSDLSLDCSAAVFNFPGAAYVVGNEQISLTAQFDSTGHLLTGTGYNDTYKISGTLAPSSKPSFEGETPPKGVSWGAVPNQTLFSTDLTATTVDSADEALGFKSTHFGGWANQLQFTGGSTVESVWLYSLLSGLEGVGDKASSAYPGWEKSSWNSFLAELKSHSSKTPLVAGTFFGVASIATVPLPGALWLLAGSLAGLGALRRRRMARV